MEGTRPATISELAAAAQSDPDLSSTSKQDIKYYIRRAETHRKEGKALASGAKKRTGDLGTDMELAFIEYAQSATLIVEKIPSHRDYNTALTAEQRTNLTAVGTFSATTWPPFDACLRYSDAHGLTERPRHPHATRSSQGDPRGTL
ncbi:hypothetical protein FB45DRAFT_760121 [Roridomyces roridus]|uniref:Uncharacterized protein n=1 Tax=Roridomyces roridus TaxID=1738132 RepID=A0AAD7FCM0_9AGAR|nr:hypothetical protein FB45DRAFT_760121 [Roridomyces roridus]